MFSGPQEQDFKLKLKNVKSQLIEFRDAAILVVHLISSS